jgi:hypothetical protein
MTGPTIRDQRAFASGVLFVAFAIFFLVTALNYPAGLQPERGRAIFPGCLRSRWPPSDWPCCWTAQHQALHQWVVKGLAWVTGSLAAVKEEWRLAR